MLLSLALAPNLFVLLICDQQDPEDSHPGPHAFVRPSVRIICLDALIILTLILTCDALKIKANVHHLSARYQCTSEERRFFGGPRLPLNAGYLAVKDSRQMEESLTTRLCLFF